MGWLGWTEQQALDTSIESIRLAYEGRVDLLKSIFGGKDDPPSGRRRVSKRKASAKLFDALFGAGRRNPRKNGE